MTKGKLKGDTVWSDSNYHKGLELHLQNRKNPKLKNNNKTKNKTKQTSLIDHCVEGINSV